MHLFSPLSIGPLRLPNRIVCSALASGHCTAEGSASPALASYYAARAGGGAGTVVIEACWPLQPSRRVPHLGLYDDALIPGLHLVIDQVHRAGACALVLVDQPLDVAQLTDGELTQLSRAWVAAALRASQAGADGVMLSCADGGPFHQLLSPLSNRRAGLFGGTLEQRTRLLLETAEHMRRRFNGRMLLGLRLLADEFVPGGVSIQDARVVARRLTGAGIDLIEVFALAGGASPMAVFPGWRAPLAASVRAIVDVPVMVGDLNDDPMFANSVLAERSADLLALGEVLRADPTWPQRARATLGLQPHQERLRR